jgi:hypothetical protein
MSDTQSSNEESEKSLTEAKSQEAFGEITKKISEFDSHLHGRKYNDDSVVPYFLYVITPNGEGKLVSFSNSDNTVAGNILNTTELDSNNSQQSISDVIKAHISTGLQQLYNSSSTSSVDSSISGHHQVLPITSTTVDKIIEYYSIHIDKLSSAVADINSKYDIQLVSDETEMSGITHDSSTASDVIKRFATNDDGYTIETLTALLKLPKNQELLEDKVYEEPTEGGSRSRKHRRRHRKKNKNTKRRSRK